MSTLIFLRSVTSVATFLAICDYQRRGRLPYLPVPRPLFSTGNRCDVPKERCMNRTLVELYLKEWMTGDFFGQIIVLNSVKATKGLLGLLERLSYIYSVLSSRCMKCMYFWSTTPSYDSALEASREKRPTTSHLTRSVTV